MTDNPRRFKINWTLKSNNDEIEPHTLDNRSELRHRLFNETQPKKEPTNMLDIQKVLDALNSAYQADPHAFRALLINVVPANQALVDHPHIVVNGNLNPYVTVGLLGVINGVLTSLDLPRIAAKWSDKKREDGTYEFLGFQVADPRCQPEKK